MPQVHVSPAYQYGTPLRSWTEEPPQFASAAAELAIKASQSLEAVRKLIAGEIVTVEEELTLGRLNSQCFLMGYEPMVLLIERPRLNPTVGSLLLGFSKHFRTQ